MGLRGYSTGIIDTGSFMQSPTNPPELWGFTAGIEVLANPLLIVILVANTAAASGPWLVTGPATGSAAKVSATPWTAGDLRDYLVALPVTGPIGAFPDNPIGAFLPHTQSLWPDAIGFDVFMADIHGGVDLDAAPHVRPIFNLSQPPAPAGSWILAFAYDFGSSSWIATEPTGAIIVGWRAKAKVNAVFIA